MLAFNAYIELAMYYVPTLKRDLLGRIVSAAPLACSAFVATGSQTKDGKIVMGHNLWWDYIMGQRFNAVLDIRPEHGHEVLIEALCGFIHSGSDFAINSAGLMLCETTISGFSGFDPEGKPEFERMRKAIQYSDNLDDMVRIFRDGNNGGYANTWLMGDSKKNEIGKLELGLKNVTFERKSDGAYVGSNFPENPKLIQEECTGYNPDPKRNGCEVRRARWNLLLDQNKGQVDAEMAKKFLGDTTAAPGVGGSSLCFRGDLAFGGLDGQVNAKVVTSDMAAKMQIWVRAGFADGSELKAKDFIAKHPNYAKLAPFLRDFVAQPWTIASGSATH